MGSTLGLLLMAIIAPPGPGDGAARDRHPVGLAASPDGTRLFVANRRSGSLSVVDPVAGRVVAEHDVARSLGGLALLPDGRLLAVDPEGDALLVIKGAGGPGPVVVEWRVGVAAGPASVLATPDGSSAVVASTASRRLTVVDLAGDDAPRLARSIALPFAPGLLAWADPGRKLVAADADGGRIAVVDPSTGLVESTRSIPGHNIRGMARTPDGRALVVAHQTLNRLARTSFEDVHWGSLLGNHLRILRLDAVLSPGADLLKGARVVDLGRVGRAAGDPGAIAFDRMGRLAVALSGVGEVALIADPTSSYARRVAVGAGTSAVLPSADGSLVYVADSLDDTITVVDVMAGSSTRTIPLGPRPEPGPAARGERLFGDARLSHDGWMSCRSCHADARATGLVVDTLSDGGFGAPKLVPPLLGVGSTGPWTWLGTANRLEDQVRKSVEATMRGRPPTPGQVDDLTAYLRSLEPPRVLAAEVDAGAAARGREVFGARKCAGCHAPPAYTSEGRYDVGLPDEAGNRRFNPPSLRGVSDRSPLLHDGRAASLPEVFLRHRHPGDSAWEPAEVDDLTAFLRTL